MAKQKGRVENFVGAEKPKGNRVFFNPRERRLAGLQMYYDRMHGASLKELSKTYKLNGTTVRRLLDLATDDDLVKKIENQILSDVVPMAVAVYKKKLEEGSEFVAKDVLANFAKIADRGIKREELAKQDKEDEDSLEFLLRIKGKRTLTGAPMEEVIDATTITDSRQLTSGTDGTSEYVEAGLAQAVEAELRSDLQADRLTPQGKTTLSSGRVKGGFPQAARQVNAEKGFTSVREMLKEEMKRNG